MKKKKMKRQVNIAMKKNKAKKVCVIIGLSSFLILYLISFACAMDERDDGFYFTVKDIKTGETIFVTSRYVNEGDQYLNEENKLFEVIKVEKDAAYAKFIKKENLMDLLKTTGRIDEAETSSAQGQLTKRIGIYCTHSDESYAPTDGRSSIPGHGGIFEVAETLKKALEKNGVEVFFSDRPHDPHDGTAYQRSRRTAAELLKNRLDALIDVHRDAVPAQYYKGNIKGEDIAKIRLVVGRQNPNRAANDNFAKQLKAISDKIYPGLVKGIFYAKGDYNQDLAPRTILIEAGSNTNSRQDAEEGAAFFADVVTRTLYGADNRKDIGPGGMAAPIRGETASIGKTLLWIIALAVVGIGGYVLISGGSYKEISSKIKKFANEELANFLGRKRKK